MPIRINLLAEAQAVEDSRRRDPVKRAIYVASCLVAMVLVWISSLQVKIMADNSHLGDLQARLNSHTNDYNRVLSNKRVLTDVNDKLTALNHLAADRFLQAPVLNALMHSTTDGIQIIKLRTELNFESQLEVKGSSGAVTRPAAALQKTKLLLDARDSSANPGSEQINKFKEILAHTHYFETAQISTNNILLRNLSPPQLDNDSGKPYVLFTLECDYPERSR